MPPGVSGAAGGGGAPVAPGREGSLVGDVVVAALVALWREWPPEWTPFVVRAALLVSAALATAAATFRALPRTGPALALFGCAVALAAFGLGAALPVHPWWKGICFLHGAASLGKLLALGRPRGTTPGFVRGAAFVLLWPGIDPDAAFVTDPAADRGAGLRALVVGVCEVMLAFVVGDRLLAWGAFDSVEPFPSWARAASFVPLMDGTFRAANGACRLLGLRSERVFDEPWLMTDLADYWGRRWNRFVGRTLTLEVFAPVKRRWGRVYGVLAAFFASGVLHELLFRAPLGRAEDGRFVAFFLVQGLAILAFARLMPHPGRSTLAAIAGRAAAWAVLLGSAPLFFGGTYRKVLPIEHTLRLLGITD